MGTFTAQILIGNNHRYGGGIIPSHAVFLSENSRPAWILKNLDLNEFRTKINPAWTYEHFRSLGDSDYKKDGE
jgi:hypothetical protein